MSDNLLLRIWESPKFTFYSKLLGCAIGGGSFVLFICNNQIQYLKDRNEDIAKTYELHRDLDKKKCENDQDEMRLNLEKSLDRQYKKLKKDSKAATLFLETYDIIKEAKSK